MSDPMNDPAAADKAPESKRDRFVRIAARRTQHVLERLRILGNCSNRGAYEYSPEDVEKIFNTIQEELGLTRRKFEDRNKKRSEFTL
jgi:hypothetical protein